MASHDFAGFDVSTRLRLSHMTASQFRALVDKLGLDRSQFNFAQSPAVWIDGLQDQLTVEGKWPEFRELFGVPQRSEPSPVHQEPSPAMKASSGQMPPRVKPPRVFISYGWSPAGQKERVRFFADMLRNESGVDAWIDQYDSHQPRPWFTWMLEQIQQADKVLMVFTPEYRERFEGKLPPEGGGKGVRFEGIAVTSAIYGAGGDNSKFRPILLGDTKAECIPDWIRYSYTTFSPDEPQGYEELVRWIYDQPAVAPPPLRGKGPGSGGAPVS